MSVRIVVGVTQFPRERKIGPSLAAGGDQALVDAAVAVGFGDEHAVQLGVRARPAGEDGCHVCDPRGGHPQRGFVIEEFDRPVGDADVVLERTTKLLEVDHCFFCLDFPGRGWFGRILMAASATSR